MLKILEIYPRPLDIHGDLDVKFNDPNRAYTDLKVEEGYEPFLTESKNDRNSMVINLDIEFLCSHCTTKNESKPITFNPEYQRDNLSFKQQQELIRKHDSKCNITGVSLKEKKNLSADIFCRTLKTINFDHRRPHYKGGNNDPSNFQLLSEYINREKSKVCKMCQNPKCEECALAYPKQHEKIIPTGQGINELGLNTK